MAVLIHEPMYYLSKILTANSLGILIGAISGIAINLLTNPADLPHYTISVILFSFTLIPLIGLTIINKAFVNRYNAYKIDEAKQLKLAREVGTSFSYRSEKDVWEYVVNREVKTKCWYVGLLVLFIALLVFSATSFISTTSNINNQEISTQKRLDVKIDSVLLLLKQKK